MIREPIITISFHNPVELAHRNVNNTKILRVVAATDAAANRRNMCHL